MDSREADRKAEEKLKDENIVIMNEQGENLYESINDQQ